MESRPAIEIMQHQKAVQIAIDLLIDSIECLQLIPDTADPGPERSIDAILVDAQQVSRTVNAIACYHIPTTSGLDDDILLSQSMAVTLSDVNAWQNIVAISFQKMQPMFVCGIESAPDIRGI